MGKTKGQPESTPKKEPHRAGVSRDPKIQTALVEMAWQVAIPFMVLTLGGNWIDGQQDTEPVFTIIGMFLGLAAATLLVYRIVQRHYPNTFKKEDDK